MNKLLLIPGLLLLALTSACGSVPKRDSVVGNWQVMIDNPGKSSMLCYAGAVPQDSSGSIKHRDSTPYIMATRRPSGKIEISVSGGYMFMPSGRVVLKVDDENFTLFSKGNVAWARDDEEDKTIIDAMREADDIEVLGVSEDRLTSNDTYSPDGFAAAIARIRKLCP